MHALLIPIDINGDGDGDGDGNGGFAGLGGLAFVIDTTALYNTHPLQIHQPCMQENNPIFPRSSPARTIHNIMHDMATSPNVLNLPTPSPSQPVLLPTSTPHKIRPFPSPSKQASRYRRGNVAISELRTGTRSRSRARDADR